MPKDLSSFAPTILRLALGLFCVRLGMWGYLESGPFKAAIDTYAGFSEFPLAIYVGLGPYVLFAAGGLLMLGLLTRAAALFAILIFLPLVMAAGAVSVLENPMVLIPEQRTLYKDIVILVGFASLVLSGSGAVSVDNVLSGFYRGNQAKV